MSNHTFVFTARSLKGDSCVVENNLTTKKFIKTFNNLSKYTSETNVTDMHQKTHTYYFMLNLNAGT